MSTNYHTQIAVAASAVPATLNSPLGELDTAIDRTLHSGTSDPVAPSVGDRWFRTDSDKLYIELSTGTAEVLTGSGSAGVVDITGTAGEDLAERARVYLSLSDGEWYKVDTDATATVKLSPIRGFVAESGGILNGSTGAIRTEGVLGGFSGLSAGGVVYGSTTAGSYTQTKPAVTDGGGQVAIDRAGQAISTTEVLIQKFPAEYVERETLANNGTLTIEHHADAATYTRQVEASIVTEEAGSSLTSYADTNQDVGVPLRGPSGAGATVTPDAAGATFEYVGNDSGSNNDWAAQSFQITAGRLSQITVYFLANGGSPTGTVTWDIRTDNGGNPSSTILQTGTFTPTPSSNNTITVTDGIFLAAATTYWLVLRSTVAQSAGNYWQWAANASGAYASGVAKYSINGGSSWGSYGASYDMRCSITAAAVSVGDKLAQGFQVTGAQTVGSVQLYLKKTGSPTGTMTLRVETDSGGDPSGTLADVNATTTLSESTLATNYGDITFAFATAFSISGSTQYHVVLSTDRSTDTSNYVLWGADASSPSYANGEMKSEASSTWSAESKDGIFDVLGEDVEYIEPVAIGRWSGGTRDCAVRYDDEAGANDTTKTSFKNVMGSSVDMTCIVRL